MMTLPEFRAWVLNELSDAERPSDKLYGILAKMEQECQTIRPAWPGGEMPCGISLEIQGFGGAGCLPPGSKVDSGTFRIRRPGSAERREAPMVDVSYGPFGPEIPL
jgi:hypothetical protein